MATYKLSRKEIVSAVLLFLGAAAVLFVSAGAVMGIIDLTYTKENGLCWTMPQEARQCAKFKAKE